MRIPVNLQAHDFLKQCKTKNKWVYKKSEVKKSLREHLSLINMMFSPYKWIFVVKKSIVTTDEAIRKNIFPILALIWWVVSWEFIMNYYLWKKKDTYEFEIFRSNKNFTSYLWDSKKIKLKTKWSSIKRLTKVIEIEWVELTIESPLSYIVNHISKLYNNKTFIEFVLSQNFESIDIINWLLSNYKISWLSKLAILYKNYWREWQYLTIKSALISSWKKLDRRNNKIKKLTEPKIKKNKSSLNLDNLI